MTKPPVPRRSVLFLPADKPRALDKARGLAADVVVLDLEDAVAPEGKAAARAAAQAALSSGDWGTRELVLRVNALDTPWGADDLAMAASSGAAAVLVPKVTGPACIARYHAALAGAPAGLALWAMVETCAAMLRLDAIGSAAQGTRLALLMAGTNDLAKEMRARPDAARSQLTGLLAQLVCAARAHGLVAIDGVCNRFDDPAVVLAEAEQGRALGFDGKSLIHPAQIEAANTAFAPGAAELEQARAVVAAFALPENAGKGAIQVNGRMAELLHAEQARATLALAEAIAARAG